MNTGVGVKDSRSPKSSHRLADGRRCSSDDILQLALRGLERASAALLESGGGVGDGTGEGCAAERGREAGGHFLCVVLRLWLLVRWVVRAGVCMDGWMLEVGCLFGA